MSDGSPDEPDVEGVVADVRAFLADARLTPSEAAVPRVAGALGASPAAVRDALAALGSGDGPERLGDSDTSDDETGVRHASNDGHADTPPPEGDDPGGGAEADDAPRNDDHRRDPEEWPVVDGEEWGDADFTAPEPDVFAPELLEREKWMGREGKRPFAPWGDRDHPEADADDDARWKWGLEENYAGGETALEWAAKDPRLDGVTFLQHDEDPWVFVDGDDVRDPETGTVHPAFAAILEHLGATYADVSTSGAGVHAYYRADELPVDGKEQARFAVDDAPWGANDEPPVVEIYANKHVNVATGEHVPNTPIEVREWNADALRSILEAAGYTDEPDKPQHDTDCSPGPELAEHDADATGADETATDVRDVLKAVDRLKPRDVRLSTTRSGTDATGWATFDPSYRSSESGESLHYNGEGAFYDHAEGEAFGVLSLVAAEERIISDPWDRLAGDEWWAAVDAARDRGASIPHYDPPEDGESEPVAALPLGRLDALDRDDARRYARKRGVEWPSTDTVRDRLETTLVEAAQDGANVVVDTETASGKSYTAATTAWRDRLDGRPVVHLHPTRDTRDDLAADSRDALGDDAVRGLRSGFEACPVAAGKHDPENVDDDETPVVTVDGEPASEWFDCIVNDRGVPFSVVHALARDQHDQGRPNLPCSPGEQLCECEAQWAGVPRDDDGDPTADVVHATHAFAKVPSLRTETVVVLDELADYEVELEHDRARRAITAFLRLSDDGPDTFEEFVTAARSLDGESDPFAAPTGPDVPGGGRIAADRDRLANVLAALDTEPPTQWYLNHDDAHALAPALAKAVFGALRDREPFDANGRATHRVKHRPPRFDDDARDDDRWNREWVTVVVDDDHTIRRVRAAPDFSTAHAVIGLDARPVTRMWRRNAGPDLTREPILDDDERRCWRLYERGHRVVQVGDADRPAGSDGQYYDHDGDRALVEAIRAQGFDLRTAVAPKVAEHDVEQILAESGATDPDTMHFGEEKSRNDFAGESAGFVTHAIDPGDEYVLDWLAECGLEATPERTDVDGDAGACDVCGGDGCRECGGTGRKRARGRGWDGDDADAAARFLESVRATHLAQAAGRWARDPDDPDDTATVFVRSAALPETYADLQVPGVEWVPTDAQRDVLTALRERPSATARELADVADVTTQHVRDTLEHVGDAVTVRERAGEHGAHLYRALAGLSTAAGVDLEPGAEETTNDPVCNSYTWALAVSSPHARLATDVDGLTALSSADHPDRPGSQAGLEAFDTPPPGH